METKVKELSEHEIININGGDGFAEDVGEIIGFSIKFNYNVLKWVYDSIIG